MTGEQEHVLDLARQAVEAAMAADGRVRGKYAGALLEACAIEMRTAQGDT